MGGYNMAQTSNKDQNFPTWLENQLRRTGLSNRQLAKKLGVLPALIGKWRRGDVKTPKLENMVELAKIFNEDLNVLMELVKNSRQPIIDKHRGDTETDSIVVEVEDIIDRKDELKKLDEYRQRSRLILITGILGIGKSILAKTFYNLQSQEKILFKCNYKTSIKDIAEYVELSSEYDLIGDPIRFILQKLKRDRHLLVLDNLDLEHPEHGESYRQLLEQIAETGHQSCVIVTCRSLPRGYLSWEPSPEVMRLNGLTESEAYNFLVSLGISPESDRELLKALFNKYGGNPFGLRLAARDILDNFKGDLSAYLKHSTLFVGDLHDEIQNSIQHLSNLELELLYWLALQKEAICLGDILKEFPDRYKTSSRSTDINKAVKELDRRSLLQSHDSEFYLQTEVQTYVEIYFLNAVQSEIEDFLLDADVYKLQWLRCLNLSDEQIKLRDRLFRRDPELMGQAYGNLEVISRQPEKIIGHAIANFNYLNLGLHTATRAEKTLVL